MYYRDVPLFKAQGTVDRVRPLSMDYRCWLRTHATQLVDDLAMTLNLERADLKIVASVILSQVYLLNVVVARCIEGPPVRYGVDNSSSRRRNYFYQ
jgi:hypothetical protein